MEKVILQTAHIDKSFLERKRNQSRLPAPIWMVVNSPKATVGVCLLAAASCFLISLYLTLLFLSLSYVFIAYYVERRHLNTLPVPPLAIFSIANFFYAGLGPILASDDLSSKLYDPLLITQAVHILSFPVFIVIYWLFNRRNRPIVLADYIGDAGNKRQLRLVAIIIVAFTVTLHFIEIYTGVADRGYAGDFVVETPFGIWSYFEAFSKLQYIGYMLIPFLYRTSGKIVRFSLVTLLGLHILFQIASSSRGAVVFPLVFVGFGYWMIGGSAKRVIILFVALIVILLLMTPILGEFRGSPGFMTSRLVDLGDRLNLLGDTVKSRRGLDIEGRRYDLQVTGRALLGCSDPLVYANTPSVFPFAGWEGAEAILYVWVPKMFYRDKPLLLDGNEITVQYTGVRFDRSGITPSIQADLYRRFGWSGVLVGYPFYALAASLLVRYGFNSFHRSKKKGTYGLLVILFIATFIHGIPFGSVLTMVWNFFWDYPKYLVALGLIAFFAKVRVR